MQPRSLSVAFAVLCVSAALGSCGGDEAAALAPRLLDRATITAMFGPQAAAPVDNRPSAAKIALGRSLYHEVRLSKHGDISCARCHDLDSYGQDGLRTSPGTGGAAGERNSPTTFNAFLQFAQFWDWRAETVEEQSTMPILTANEHGLQDEAEIEHILRAVPEYAASFGRAFPGESQPITAANVRLAIGAFERTLITRGRWDRFLDGDDGALSEAEKHGLATFVEVGCTTCHLTRGVGGAMPQKLGLVKSVDTTDLGRYRVTGDAADTKMFKVPQLLNVAETAPYLHDGSIATLEAAVRFMGEHQLGVELTSAQVDSIVGFLRALTGDLVQN